MATFLTSITRKNTTATQWKFYDLLTRCLDDDYLVWFEAPNVFSGRTLPDFLIFHQRYGLLGIEIRDWKMKSVKKIDAESVYLGIKREAYRHPVQVARECLLPFILQMQKDAQLVQKAGQRAGDLVFSWGYGAVIGGWERCKVSPSKKVLLDRYFSEHDCLLDDELLTIDEPRFLQWLHGLSLYHYSQPLTEVQTQKVRAYLFPECIANDVRFKLPKNLDKMDLPDTVRVMDNTQEYIVRNLGDGHRVIHGVAGSGKTLLLEYFAKKRAAEEFQKPILVMCFNTMLSSILRKRLPKNVDVFYFYEWCDKIKREYGISGKDDEMSVADDVCRAILQRGVLNGAYSSILIDEGHDFKSEQLKALVKTVDPDTNSLLLFYDDAQNIRDTQNLKFPLKSVGIKAQGRTTILRINYRNTQEILSVAFNFYQQFIAVNDIEDGEDGALNREIFADEEQKIPLIRPVKSGRASGIVPILRLCQSADEECQYIAKTIDNWLKAGVLRGDIAVLYFNKKSQLGDELKAVLEKEGISAQCLNNPKAKKEFVYQSDKITLSTVTASKGSEFSHVILAGLGDFKMETLKLNKLESSVRQIYVGMTRAIHCLVLTSARENVFTKTLEEVLSKSLSDEGTLNEEK